MFGGLKFVSRAALVAAAVSMGGVAAQAADLGGNCCADLEERVAELEATTARKGNRKVSLQVYGQVNRGMVWHDDDTSAVNEFSFRDIDGRSGTRFGFRGSAAVTSDLSFGYHLELAIADDTSTDFGTTRLSYVYMTSATLGQIAFGRKGTATDGLAEIALGGVITPFGSEEGSAVSPVASNATGNGFDGARRQGVHYTSPAVAGFILSASYFHDVNANVDGDNDRDGWDAALRYAGEFGAIRVAAGVGYRLEMKGAGLEDEGIFIVSGSIKHTPTGLFLNGGYGQSDDVAGIAGAEIDGWNIQAGISQNWFGIGSTTLAGNYGAQDENGIDSEYYGFGIVQNVDAAATDLYITWQKYDDSIDTSNVVQAGMRVKF